MPKITLPEKPFKNFDEQVQIFRKRGLIIDCDTNICLKQNNYYRLTSYLIPFKDGEDINGEEKYKAGTRLSHILRIYEMDSSFRRILMSLLEHVEVALRTYIAYTHSSLYDGMGYTCPYNFKNYEKQSKFILEILPKILELSHNKLYIRHYKEKYVEQYPIWVISEILTFDNLFNLYKNMYNEDQALLCRNFIGVSRSSLYHWMTELKTLRNECAHYHRLYNIPRCSLYVHEYLKSRYVIKSNWLKVFLACKYIVHSDTNWEYFVNRLELFFKDFKDVITPNELGLPKHYVSILRSPLLPVNVTELK